MRFKPRHSLPFVLFALAALAMAGCQPPFYPQAGVVGAEVAIMYLTKDQPPPPPDLEHQIPQHEDWCYETMGYAECYSKPQNTEANRLINVDPQNRYPLTRDQYYQDVATANAPAPVVPAQPVAVAPIPLPAATLVLPDSAPATGAALVGAPVTTETTTVITTTKSAPPPATTTTPAKKSKKHAKKKKTVTTASPPEPVPNVPAAAPAPVAVPAPAAAPSPPPVITTPDPALDMPTPLTPQ